MNIHHFPPFWQHGQNVSRCDKLVMITLTGMCLQQSGFEVCILSTRWSKMTNMPLIELWISSELMPENQFYEAKMNIFKMFIPSAFESLNVRFFCLLVRLWDCPENSESYSKTMRLERSTSHVVPFQCVVQCKTTPLTL